jgi:nucleoside-diphosphate-sugar epimerase
MKPSEVLITGGTGTLGRRVVERLCSEEVGVRVMSCSGCPGTVRGDLLTGEGVGEAVRSVDTVVHCAHCASISRPPGPQLRPLAVPAARREPRLTPRTAAIGVVRVW